MSNDEAPRPRSEGQVTTGEVVLHTLPQRSDSWQVRLLRAWPAVSVYLLAAGCAWLAAVATDPGPVAAVLVGVAAGNTVCAAVGIRLVVRS